MAMIKCPECGQEISDKAKKCVYCGFVFEEEIILEKCKVKKFEDLSNKVYSNVVNNWDQVLEIARSSNS